MYKRAHRLCLKSRDFAFSCFWSIKALSPVLQMESTVNSESFCFDSWTPVIRELCWICQTFFFLRVVTSDRVTSQISDRGWACSGPARVHVCEAGRNFLLWARLLLVCGHFLQEVLGFILEQKMCLKKIKSGHEEHAVIGRSGYLHLPGDFVRLYNGDRNAGGWIGLVAE